MTPTLSDAELAEIAARAEAATAGPWTLGQTLTGANLAIRADNGRTLIAEVNPIAEIVDRTNNRAFIAASRSDVPRLLAHISALQAEKEKLREAWRMDAAARLESYVALRNSGLIGEPTQVDVTLIMPTIAMLETDNSGEYLDCCELCGVEIPYGAKVGAVEIDPDYTRDACAACSGDLAIYTKEGVDVDAAIAKARAALEQPDTPKTKAENFHPAEFIVDELQKRGWTTRQVVATASGDETDLLALELYICAQQPDCRMGDALARILALGFDTSEDLWRNLETAYLAAPELAQPIDVPDSVLSP